MSMLGGGGWRRAIADERGSTDRALWPPSSTRGAGMVTCTVPWGHPAIVELPAAKRAISHGPHRTWEAPVDDDDDDVFGTARRGRKSVAGSGILRAVARQQTIKEKDGVCGLWETHGLGVRLGRRFTPCSRCWGNWSRAQHGANTDDRKAVDTIILSKMEASAIRSSYPSKAQRAPGQL